MVVAAGLLAATTTPVLPATDPTAPRAVGSLARYPADVAAALGIPDLRKATLDSVDNGVALNFPKLDRLYQIFVLRDDAPGGAATVVAERPRATLALGRVLRIPGRRAEMANGDAGAEWIATIDARNDRLFMAYSATGGAAGAGQGVVTGSNLPGLMVVDLRNFTSSTVSYPRLEVDALELAALPVGLEYDEPTDTLIQLVAAGQGTSSLANALYLVGWPNAQITAGGALPAVAPRLVRACRRDPINDATNRNLTPIMISDAPDLAGDGTTKSFLMFPCYSTTFSSNVIVARLERASALDPMSRQEQAVVSPASVANWVVDAAHGRMFLVNTAAETDAWVYEATSNAFVGIIEMSPKGKFVASSISLGVDEKTGRLYARAEGNGLMITEAAQDPVPQADVYPAFSGQAAFRILVDEKRDRILLLDGTSTGQNLEAPAYSVVAVPPPLPPPVREDPDKRTLAVGADLSNAIPQYGGNASAYGLRMLFARGFSGAVPSNGNDTAGQVYRDVNSYCGFGDREFVFGATPKTELSDTSRFARAAAVDLDSVTVTDLEQPTRCDLYNQYKGPFSPLTLVFPLLNTVGVIHSLDGAPVAASQAADSSLGPRTQWDYVAADCSRQNGDDLVGPNSAPLVGDTSVSCSSPTDIRASAESRVQPNGAVPFSVGRASSKTRVFIDPNRGLVSEATARLDDIKIGDISIGYIENVASAQARGRKGTARTAFDKPRIGFVSGPGVPACDVCDVDTVLRQLNTVLAGRAEFRRITPEPRLAAGTPGGYEAGIIKSEKQKASDNSLSGDKSVEIPALELVLYNDNSVIGRARQVVQFAGVRVDAHYGLQVASAGGSSVLGAASGNIEDDGLALPSLGSGGSLPGEGVLRQITRFFEETTKGVITAFRLVVSNPRQALLMATVWLLLAGPFFASRRRRALLAVTDSVPGATA